MRSSLDWAKRLMRLIHVGAQSRPAVNDIEAAHLLRLARTILQGELGRRESPRITRQTTLISTLVNITIMVDGQVRASATRQAPSLHEGIILASRKAAAESRSGDPISTDELAKARIHLWIRDGKVALRNPSEVDLGLEGIEMYRGRSHAYYKPSVPLTSRITSVSRLLSRLSRKAGLSKEAWRRKGTRLFRTSWLHFVELPEKGDAAMRLARFRPIKSSVVSKSDIESALESAENRMLGIQQPDGFFLYLYHPFRGVVPSKSNLVRQAGCAFALSRAACGEPNENRAAKLFASADKACLALMRIRASSTTDSAFVIDSFDGDQPSGKLGSTALLLAALLQSPLNSQLAQERMRLLNHVISMQRHDGSFRCRTDSTTFEADGSAQDFFPGEALTALCLALRGNPKETLPAILRAFPRYRSHFRRHPSTAFIPWHIEAWRQLMDWQESNDLELDVSGSVVRFVFEMADWLLGFQIVKASTRHSDFIGGFSKFGAEPSASTASFTEGIIRAFGLALRTREPEKAARYRVGAQLGLQFMMRLQISSEIGFLFPSSQHVVGGTPHSLSDLTIRCDNDQHAITAYRAALDNPELFNDHSADGA